MVTVAPFHRIAIAALALTTFGLSRPSGQPAFSDREKEAVLNFWTEQAKYTAEPASPPGSEWCVRLTPAGSKWIREVYRQFQSGKVVPTQDPSGFTPEQQAWTAWIDRQVKRDWDAAEQKAAELNGASAKSTSGTPTEPPPPAKTLSDRKAGTDKVGRTPDPSPQPEDPCPAKLVALVGTPPRFSAPVRPMRHTVVFPDGVTLNYTDNVKVRQKYAYYRFADGVNSEGQSVKLIADGELSSLFRSAGIPASQQKVMKAVSLLEGGFDSVNTYDTGFVSVGFIQFACLSDGSGSLGKMMQSYKDANPAGFQNDFRQYGLDCVDGKLVALDLETGEEKVGADAAMQVVHEKRLIAAFQRAGLMSSAFRVAQLRAARDQFYPADDVLQLNLGGTECTVRVGDVFKTEAGMATVMDRKVNTGKIAGIQDTVQQLADKYGITKVSDLPDIEYLAARAVAYRQDYTLVASLTRPRDNTVELSRRGTRLGRTGAPASGGGGTPSRGGKVKRKGG